MEMSKKDKRLKTGSSSDYSPSAKKPTFYFEAFVKLSIFVF